MPIASKSPIQVWKTVQNFYSVIQRKLVVYEISIVCACLRAICSLTLHLEVQYNSVQCACLVSFVPANAFSQI